MNAHPVRQVGEADDPLQSYCASCGIIQRVNRLPDMTKADGGSVVSVEVSEMPSQSAHSTGV